MRVLDVENQHDVDETLSDSGGARVEDEDFKRAGLRLPRPRNATPISGQLNEDGFAPRLQFAEIWVALHPDAKIKNERLLSWRPTLRVDKDAVDLLGMSPRVRGAGKAAHEPPGRGYRLLARGLEHEATSSKRQKRACATIRLERPITA